MWYVPRIPSLEKLRKESPKYAANLDKHYKTLSQKGVGVVNVNSILYKK